DDVFKAKTEELEQRRRDILESRRKMLDELDKEQDKKLDEILSVVRRITEKIAKAKGYQIVLWKHTLAYADKSLDLTKDVLDEFVKEPMTESTTADTGATTGAGVGTGTTAPKDQPVKEQPK